MAKLVGKWKLDRSENFEEYMKALGVSVFIRKAALIMPNPTCEIEHPDDIQFVIVMNVPVVMKHVQKFTLGVPFEDMIPNGDMQMTVVSQEGDTKLTFREEVEGDEPHVVTRELVDGEMVMVLKKGNTTCKRVFTRVK
ncbi:Cellular retinoic acid-binding protein 1 [Holothuria leucospilota]|uniref:Cellular retinoic acid-binding protein 1 n=1 Tax=Holothuria leucospilota TaxID=206669 RepID=A0A9Q1CH65_HOLLE|nr:Cellular retinoic acid-binding protein 1 [Holothuria leucospilota]